MKLIRFVCEPVVQKSFVKTDKYYRFVINIFRPISESKMKPCFNFNRTRDGMRLSLSDTPAAMAVRSEHRERDYKPARPVLKVKEEAITRVESLGGDSGNTKHLLGQYTIEFGQYR